MVIIRFAARMIIDGPHVYAARIIMRIFLPHLTVGRMNMFFQKPGSLLLCRFWTFELLYYPIVIPSLQKQNHIIALYMFYL